jgi:hypothetical protein
MIHHQTLGLIGPLSMIEVWILLACFAFWIWMIVDCAVHETGKTRVGLLSFIILLGFIGAPYYLLAYKLPRYV